jgi:hypothetical protein
LFGDTEPVTARKRTARGAIVAFVPFLVLLAWIGNILGATILAIPSLVLGVRIERDGDWSARRRVAALLVAVAFAVVTAGGWGELGIVLAPIVGIAVWAIAGRGRIAGSIGSGGR